MTSWSTTGTEAIQRAHELRQDAIKRAMTFHRSSGIGAQPTSLYGPSLSSINTTSPLTSNPYASQTSSMYVPSDALASSPGTSYVKSGYEASTGYSSTHPTSQFQPQVAANNASRGSIRNWQKPWDSTISNASLPQTSKLTENANTKSPILSGPINDKAQFVEQVLQSQSQENKYKFKPRARTATGNKPYIPTNPQTISRAPWELSSTSTRPSKPIEAISTLSQRPTLHRPQSRAQSAYVQDRESLSRVGTVGSSIRPTMPAKPPFYPFDSVRPEFKSEKSELINELRSKIGTLKGSMHPPLAPQYRRESPKAVERYSPKAMARTVTTQNNTFASASSVSSPRNNSPEPYHKPAESNEQVDDRPKRVDKDSSPLQEGKREIDRTRNRILQQMKALSAEWDELKEREKALDERTKKETSNPAKVNDVMQYIKNTRSQEDRSKWMRA